MGGAGKPGRPWTVNWSSSTLLQHEDYVVSPELSSLTVLPAVPVVNTPVKVKAWPLHANVHEHDHFYTHYQAKYGQHIC